VHKNFHARDVVDLDRQTVGIRNAERIAAQGSFTARAADCLYLRSKNGGEALCTAQSFRAAGIVSGDELELI